MTDHEQYLQDRVSSSHFWCSDSGTNGRRPLLQIAPDSVESLLHNFPGPQADDQNTPAAALRDTTTEVSTSSRVDSALLSQNDVLNLLHERPGEGFSERASRPQITQTIATDDPNDYAEICGARNSISENYVQLDCAKQWDENVEWPIQSKFHTKIASIPRRPMKKGSVPI